MSNITTVTRFKLYAGITGTAQDNLIGALIPMVQSQIERYLRRSLESATYRMWIDGSGGPLLRLDQYPITALYQVSLGTHSVAYVTNTSATVAKAFVAFDGTNVILMEISTTGVETASELPVATSKTLSALKTAIELKTGWSCIMLSPEYGTLPTTQLRPLYGMDALNPCSADLVLPGNSSPAKIVFEDAISIINSEQFPTWDVFPQDRQPNRMSSMQPGITPPTFSYGFPPGTGNIFVWFKAGYVFPTDSIEGTLPAGLSLSVNQILQDVLGSTKVNSNMQSESIGDYSYSLRSTKEGAIASAIENRKKDLNQYRRVSL